MWTNTRNGAPKTKRRYACTCKPYMRRECKCKCKRERKYQYQYERKKGAATSVGTGAFVRTYSIEFGVWMDGRTYVRIRVAVAADATSQPTERPSDRVHAAHVLVRNVHGTHTHTYLPTYLLTYTRIRVASCYLRVHLPGHLYSYERVNFVYSRIPVPSIRRVSRDERVRELLLPYMEQISSLMGPVAVPPTKVRLQKSTHVRAKFALSVFSVVFFPLRPRSSLFGQHLAAAYPPQLLSRQSVSPSVRPSVCSPLAVRKLRFRGAGGRRRCVRRFASRVRILGQRRDGSDASTVRRFPSSSFPSFWKGARNRIRCSSS